MIDELADSYKPIVEGVLENMIGRSADQSTDRINTRRLAALAVMAGDGDTLEIGSYFGASAIITALAKDQAGVTGSVYCIDPLDGREQMTDNGTQTHTQCYDTFSGQYWTADTFAYNRDKFMVDLILIQQPSIPFPEELDGMTFTVAFIDGDHWHNAPETDWRNVRHITTKYVVFDDADCLHPYVMRAVAEAKHDTDWKLLLHDGGLCVFERAP